MELPDPVRRRLGNFSRTVFRDSSWTGPEHSEDPDNEVNSSMALQMALYFNTYFFPLWWVGSILMLHMKYSFLPDYYKFIVITIIVLVTLIEAIRLYLGYMGNLQEKDSGNHKSTCNLHQRQKHLFTANPAAVDNMRHIKSKSECTRASKEIFIISVEKIPPSIPFRAKNKVRQVENMLETVGNCPMEIFLL
ncbi:transmembrane protein 17 isoform X2 [Fukomys damarensis]|uniref:transmembrane protein 17 isoform X2 n=1 Tax=Fukomys damarensis TaxID=885580 RepID=UPI00053F49CA|nr:transmembrane protein 17 isoform X2 [Fukomys damarensis]